MEGRISFFNQQEGIGKIVTRDKKVFSFDMDSWVGFDMLPNTGLLVEFKQDGNRVFEIVSKERPNGDSSTDDEVGLNISVKESIDRYFTPIKNLLSEHALLLESKKRA